MKSAIYIQDGHTQAVLTPENDFEKTVLDAICKQDYRYDRVQGSSMMPSTVKVFRGDFYECSGGWLRYECSGGWFREKSWDNSLIFRVVKDVPATLGEKVEDGK